MKKFLYYLPTIILIIYIIIYPLLLRYNVEKEEFAFHANDNMDRLSLLIILVATIAKIYFKKNKFKTINKLDTGINNTLFILSIIAILFLGIATAYA